MSIETFNSRPIPLEVAAAYFVSLKQASAIDPPDQSNELEGAFAQPVPQVLAAISSAVQNRMGLVYAYTAFAQTLHSLSHESLSQLFQGYSDEILESVDYLMQRLSALAGPAQLADIPAPPASSDPFDILQTMIRKQQEGIALLRVLHAACGDNPMKYQLEQVMLEDQKNIDEMWHHLPTELRSAIPTQAPATKVEPGAAKTASVLRKLAGLEDEAAAAGMFGGGGGMLSPGHYSGKLDISSEPKETLRHIRANPLAYAGGVAGGLTGTAAAAKLLKGKGLGYQALLVPAGGVVGGMMGGIAGDTLQDVRHSRFRKTAAEMGLVPPDGAAPSPVDTPNTDPQPAIPPDAGGARDPHAAAALQQELAAQQAEDAAFGEFYRQKFKETAQQLQLVQQQAQQQGEQLQQVQQAQAQVQQQLDQQVQMGQQLQQQATQTASAANQAAATAIQSSLSAQQDLIQQQSASAQMHNAYESIRGQLAQIAQQAPPPPLAPSGSLAGGGGAATPEGPAGQAPPPGSPGATPAPAEDGSGGAGEQPGGAPNPGAPTADATAEPTTQVSADKAASAHIEYVRKQQLWREKSAALNGARIGGAIAGGLAGGLGTVAMASGDLGKMRARIQELEAQPESFRNSMALARTKAQAAFTEVAEKHPVGAMTLGTLMGASMGHGLAGNIGHIAENAAPTIK